MVGLRVVAAWKFDDVFRMQSQCVTDLSVMLLQISGHPANDGKQINILSGQGSCTVGFPMTCCMVPKGNLGDPPAWLWRMFLRRALIAVSNDAAGDSEQRHRIELPDRAVELVASMAGWPVYRDYLRRDGNLAFHKTHAEWANRT